jgi:hypothetical protein
MRRSVNCWDSERIDGKQCSLSLFKTFQITHSIFGDIWTSVDEVEVLADCGRKEVNQMAAKKTFGRRLLIHWQFVTSPQLR